MKKAANGLIPFALTGVIAGVLLIMPNMPFANDYTCDPWHFFGRYFLADQLLALKHTFEGSRPPEYIIGFVLTRMIHGVGAEYGNFLILFGAATIAVYCCAKRLFGLAPAIVAAVFFATQPIMFSNFALTYTDGAVAYGAISMAFAIAASTASRRLKQAVLLLAAGFFWASAVHAHLYSITMNFIVTLYCLDWSPRPPLVFVREAVRKWAMLVVGALIATVFFGLINKYVFHGSFAFFLSQFEAVGSVHILPYEKSNWYLLGGRGALLLLGAVAALAQLHWSWNRRLKTPSAVPVLTALVPFVVLEGAQLVYTIFDHGLALQYDYYFAWFIAPLAILVASVAARADWRGSLAAVALVAYLAVSLAADFGRPDLVLQGASPIPISGVVAVLFIPLFLLVLPRRAAVATFVSMLLYAGLNATIRPEKFGLAVWHRAGYRDAYTRINAGMSFLSNRHFSKLPRFWIGASGATEEAIAYARSYAYCVIDSVLPEMVSTSDPNYDPKSENFSAGDYLVMVPRDAGELALAKNKLAKNGLTFHETARDSISYAGVAYLIVVGRLY